MKITTTTARAQKKNSLNLLEVLKASPRRAFGLGSVVVLTLAALAIPMLRSSAASAPAKPEVTIGQQDPKQDPKKKNTPVAVPEDRLEIEQPYQPPEDLFGMGQTQPEITPTQKNPDAGRILAGLTGTKNIPGDYATLALAITDLNNNGVGSGGVTFNLIAGNPQTAPAGGYVIGDAGSQVLSTSSAANPVIFTGNGNTITASTPQASGNLNDAIVKLIGADFVTIQGFTMQENPANTVTTPTVSNNMTEFGIALFYFTTTDGARNNTIQNNTISLNRAYQNTFGIYSNTRHTSTSVFTTAEVTSAGGSNSNNKIYGNNISNVDYGIVFVGAGTTISAIDTGNDFGGTSAATGNTISNFGYNGTLISGYISVTSSNFAMYLNQQINDNASFNTITSAAGLSVATIQHGGIVKAYSVASPTAGTVTTTNLNNNTVTLNAAATTAQFTGVSAQGMTANSAATINMNNNLITGSISGAATTATFLGLFGTSAPGTFNINGNTVRGVTSTASSAGGFVGIQQQTNAVVTALNINNNKFGDTVAGAVTFSAATSGTVSAVIVTSTGAASTSAVTITVNDIRGIVHSVPASSPHLYFSNVAFSLSQNISSNTFTNLNVNTTGGVTFISDNVSLSPTGTKNINGNSIVTAFNKGGVGNTITPYSDFGSSVTGSVENNNNNNFSNITFIGATTFNGWLNEDGATASSGPTKTINGNTFSNISGGSGEIVVLTSTLGGGSNVTSGNTISNVTATGAVTGISIGFSSNVNNVSLNTISSLSTTSGTVVALSAAGGTTTNVFKNKIYDISSSDAAGTVNGILLSAGANANIYNNIIGDLRTPAANAANPLIGINLTGGTMDNLYYNTVYLNATSSGAIFGSSAVSVSTTPTVTLRNNAFVNTSTANTSGLTVAHRRSSTTLTSYASASNNNDFYAGMPGATNVIFNDGTNSDQTIAAYKTRVAARDSASFSENPPFLSTTGSNANFLHISAASSTQLESGGTPVSGITDDFDGQTRSASKPDVGADEFNGIAIDLTAPVITYTPFVNTSLTTNRTLVVTITDAAGVATGGLAPRIYFKRSADASYVSTQCVFASGNAQNGTYNCTVDYSLLTPPTASTGDVIQYFVVAQDTAGKVGANPIAGFAATDVNTVTSPPRTPNTYTIVSALSGAKTVCGSGCDYASLTNTGGLFDAINTNVATGNLTVSITSDLTGETGAVALNKFAEEGAGAGTYTVTINPSGAARSITGTGVNLIKLNGANRVTIDGSLTGGTDRSLTIVNTNVTTPSVIWFGSVGSTPITTDTVKNCIIRNGINTSSAVFISDASTIGNPGFFSGITIQNNDVQKAFVGVFANGGTAQNGSNVVYTQNTLNTSGANSIRSVGLYLQGVNGATVSQNTIGNFDTTNDENDTAIWLATGSTGVTVSGNTIANLGYTGTGSFGPVALRDSSGFVTSSGNILSGNSVTNITSGGSNTGGPTVLGIEVASTGTVVERNNVQGIAATNTGTYGATGINITSGNNVVLRNNFVSNVTGDMTGGVAFSTTFGIFGIRVATGTGHQIYNNSVNLYGLRSGTATSSLLTADLCIINTPSTGLDIRNNVFANNITGGTTSVANVSVALPSGGTSAMNLTLNNNAYYFGPDAARQGAGQSGTTAGTGFFTTFDPTVTTPASNLRSYTVTLSAAGTNDNASKGATTAPPFVSNTDLHLTGAGATQLLGAGATIASVVNDIDNDLRDTPPDIGADEVTTGTTSGSVPGGTYNNADLGTSTLAGDVTIKGNLTLSGTVTGGAFTLTIDCGATVTGAGGVNYVIGNVRKNFCTTGAFTYPVGTANGYSPVDVNDTATGGTAGDSLAVKAVQGYYGQNGETPALDPSSLKRYWDLNKTGSITADIKWRFLPGDVVGTGYNIIRINGISTQLTNAPNCPANPAASPCVNIAGNYFFMAAVSSFSKWTAGKQLAPTATGSTIAGRVVDANGRPIANARVTLNSTGGLSIVVQTGPFGYYTFTDLQVGTTYVVSVSSGRFSFTNPSRVINLNSDAVTEDFVADAP